jgi:hypothetical protein
MALSISIPTEFGFPATYWRVAEYHETFGSFGVVVMNGFLDASNATGEPLASKIFEIRGAQYSEDMGRAAVYGVAKQRPEFAGAQDA